MKITKYEVTLKRLTEDKIEMVRNWRNDPKIARFMEYRDHITPEMQTQWFKKINNDNNYYFIIEFEGKEIGLINIKDIDFSKKEGEGGIFIYNDDYLNSTVGFQANLCLHDFAFEELGLERIIAHIMKDNKRAVQYNKIQGLKLQPGQEDVMNQLYILEKTDYYAAQNKLIKLLNI